MTLDEIFNGMSERFQPDKAADTQMTILFDVSGDDGGQWAVKIDDGTLDVSKGSVDDPSATIKMSGPDLIGLNDGSVNPMMAFMTGKIKVEGDLNSVMKFQSIVGF